jgi:hypothetical protein
MEVIRFLAVAAAFALIAWLYRSLPQNLNGVSLRYARFSPAFRATMRTRIERELSDYRAALADAAAFQSQAMHLQALLILSATMTLLALALFIVSRLVQPQFGPAFSPYFPPVDFLLSLFFLMSLIGFRLAVFRSWMFLHRDRNLRRLERTIAALDGIATGHSAA